MYILGMEATLLSGTVKYNYRRNERYYRQNYTIVAVLMKHTYLYTYVVSLLLQLYIHVYMYK